MVVMEGDDEYIANGDEDDYFPRGGAKVQKKSIKNDRRYVFETKKPQKVLKKKLGRKERLREKNKKLILEEEIEEEQDTMFLQSPFTYKNLREGTLSLCSIIKVTPKQLSVALPERLIAKVPMDLVSQPLMELMKKDSSNILSFAHYFPEGFCLPCKVQHISKESDNSTVTVTTDPCLINAYIPFNLVCEEYTMIAAVQSCEDHGYLMSTGVTGLNAFLPHSNAEKYLKQFNSGKQLGVGQLVWCKVVKSTLSENSNMVILTIEPDEVTSTTLENVSSPDVIIPGVQVNVVIIKNTPNLLYVKELTSGEKGFITASQLEDVWSNISDYKVGMQYTVTSLYKFTLIDFVCYSMRIKPNTRCTPEIKSGTLFKRAKIVSKDVRGIYLQLELHNHIYKGVISIHGLKKTIESEQLDSLFPLGNSVTVRILNYHHLDQVYFCGTSSDLLREGGHVSEFKPGQLVNVKIQQRTKHGLLGSIGEANAPAFIPLCHITDTVDVDPAKKIKIDQIYSGRILEIQETRNSAIVTLCPSLVKNKPLTNFDQVKHGEEYYGIIRNIQPHAIVLTFFNNLTGLVQETELPKTTNKYKAGEVVKCFILKVIPNRKPILGVTKPLDQFRLTIGNEYPIAVKSITEKGLNCIVLENKKALDCFLPLEHLCDCSKLCPTLLKKYKIGDEIKEALIFTYDEQKPIFTLKLSVKKFFKHNPEIKKRGIYALKTNDCLPATISHLDENSMLVSVPIPGYNGQISTEIPRKLRKGLQVNKGISVIVQHVQPRAFKIKVACKEFKSLATYFLNELRTYLIELSKLMTSTPGDEIVAKVKSIDDNSIVVKLPNGSKGIITNRGNYQFDAGKKIKAIVLYEDPIEEVTYLCHKSKDLSQGKDTATRIVHMNKDFSVGITLCTNKVIFLNPITENLLNQWLDVEGKPFISSNATIYASQIRPFGKFHQGFVNWYGFIKRKLESKSQNDEDDDIGSDENQKIMSDDAEATSEEEEEEEEGEEENINSEDESGEDQMSEDDGSTSDEEQIMSEDISEEENDIIQKKKAAKENIQLAKPVKRISIESEVEPPKKKKRKYSQEDIEVLPTKKNKSKTEENLKKNKNASVKVQSKSNQMSEDESEEDSVNEDNEVEDQLSEDISDEENDIVQLKKTNNENKQLSKTVKRKSIENEVESAKKKKRKDSQEDTEILPTKKNKSKTEENLKKNKKDKVSQDNTDVKTKSNKISDDKISNSKDNGDNKLNTFKLDKKTRESDAAKALKQRKLKELENLSLDDVGGFDWNATPTDLAKTVAVGKVDIVQEDSDEEVVVKKKLTPAERKAAQIEAERAIREKEEELLRCEENPQSSDHFDRLLLARPNDSKLWIKYMAFHLQGTDIDKARSIARRALKQINVREEQERLNIWISLLNLENIYGSSECFEQTLSEALKFNNDYDVYIKTLGMYCESQKVNELDKLTNYLVRKFKDKTNCWLECQSALMRVGLTDKARNFLQRSLTSLPQKEHITLISRFALLENKHGFHEQAQSLFENLLTSYPQRVDLWNVYVDMLVKSDFVDVARGVLERIQSHKLPVRKMRAIYKKWLQFEEKYGNEKTIEHVRQAAESYVSDFLINKDKKDEKKKKSRKENDDDDEEEETDDGCDQSGKIKIEDDESEDDSEDED